MNKPFPKLFIAFFILALYVPKPVWAMLSQEDIDHANDCLASTVVDQFNASPGFIEPGQTVSLQWQVNAPEYCDINFYVNGIRVGKTGTMVVQPTFPINRYALEGRIQGIRATLARAPVTVNTDDCRELGIPLAKLQPMLQHVLDTVAEHAGIKQTKIAGITIAPGGLSITMYFEVDRFGINPQGRLKMRLSFNTIRGDVIPKFTYFHPQASTFLSDEWLESKIYAYQVAFLDNFKVEFNSLFKDPAFNLMDAQTERLFSLETVDHALLATICPEHFGR